MAAASSSIDEIAAAAVAKAVREAENEAQAAPVETASENNQTIVDESYQIPQISFEDSQVDHFIPYASPSVLNSETRKAMSVSSTSFDQQNLSEVEHARGHGDGATSSSSMTQLTQLPIEEEEGAQQQNDDTGAGYEEQVTSFKSNLENFESTLKTLANIDLNTTNADVLINLADQSLIKFIDSNNSEDKTVEVVNSSIKKADSTRSSTNQTSSTDSSDSSTSYKEMPIDLAAANNTEKQQQEFQLLTNVDNYILFNNNDDDDENLLVQLKPQQQQHQVEVEDNVKNKSTASSIKNEVVEKQQQLQQNESSSVKNSQQNLLNLSFQSSASSSSVSSKSSKSATKEINTSVTANNNNNKDDSLSSSSSRSDSQVSTYDSLAQRVQNLVGPIKLDPPTTKPAAAPITTSSLYAQIIQNNGKLPDTVSTTKTKFDYSSIQKDLDAIQTNLKYQRTNVSVENNNKENKEPPVVVGKSTTQPPMLKSTINLVKKSSYMEFETPKTKFNEKNEMNYYAKIGRDLLHETPMRINEASSSSQTFTTTPFVQGSTSNAQQAQYLTRFDTPSTNLSYNTFFGKVYSNDYHSSTMCYDKMAGKVRYEPDDRDIIEDDAQEDCFKKNACTSPIKFQPLSPSNSVAPAPSAHTTTVKYRLNKSPSRSAFDDDPDVILSRAKQQSGVLSTKPAGTTKTERTLNLYDMPAEHENSGETTSLFSNSLYNQQQNFQAFDKVNTKLLTQLREVVTRSPTYNDYDNSFVQKRQLVDLQAFKPPQAPPPIASTTTMTTTPTNYSSSALTAVTSTIPSAGYNNNPRLDSTNTSGPSETYESTHTGSDDARAPRLPSHAYGTRHEEPRGMKGIYEKQQQQQQVLKTVTNNNDLYGMKSQPTQQQQQQHNSVLDAENLRKVDQDLKKLLIKKSIDAPKKYENVRKKVYAVAWDIDLNDGAGAQQSNSGENDNESIDDLIVSYPTPRGNELRLSQELDNLWQNLKSKQRLTKTEEEALVKLESLILLKNQQNAENVVAAASNSNKKLDSKAVQVEVVTEEKQQKQLKQHQLNCISTQTSFIDEPKRAKKTHLEEAGVNNDIVRQKKLKIQAIIRKQKQEHEQRLKMLEKLTKLERLQAEKMKKVMLLNHNDTITSSIMADSFFQGTSDDTLTTTQSSDIDATLEHTDNDSTLNEIIQNKLASLEKLEQKYKKKLQQKKQQESDKRSSHVQVMNLKNTSVYEPPEGFYVVKEKSKIDSSKPSTQQQTAAVTNTNASQPQKVQKQTNELHADREGRVFVTIGAGGGGASVNPNNNTSRLSNQQRVSKSNSQNVSQQQAKNNQAWFQPVTIVSETTHEPLNNRKQQQQRVSSATHLNRNENARRSSPPRASYSRSPIHTHSSEDLLRRSSANHQQLRSTRDNQYQQSDYYEQPSKQQHQQQQQPKGLKKLSLQEAFEMFNFNFISRSRKRQKEVKLRADERRHEEQFRRERIDLGIDSDGNLVGRRNMIHKNLLLKHHPFSENLYLAQRRAMTAEEIKQQTNKVYKKLPEVKEREMRQKNEEERRRNRLKSNIYNRTIQQRVLNRGPNFNLNFKALE